ncbi:helix-turn-helix domain-containing protein [Labrys neptuniae]
MIDNKHLKSRAQTVLVDKPQRTDNAKYTGDKQSMAPTHSRTPREARLQVFTLRGEGYSRRQIAKIMDISPQRVGRIADRAGIPFGRRGGTRLLSCHSSPRPAEEFYAMAEEAGLSVSAYLALWVKAITEDRQASRRFLGKLVKGVR